MPTVLLPLVIFCMSGNAKCTVWPLDSMAKTDAKLYCTVWGPRVA